jgi:hypothetical protein
MRETTPAAKTRHWTLVSAAALAAVVLAGSVAALAASRGQLSFDPACRFAWGDAIELVACGRGTGTTTVIDAWRVWRVGPVVLSVPIRPNPVHPVKTNPK